MRQSSQLCMNWSFSFKAFAGMPRHAVITAAMLSCLSAVAVADSQLSATCCGSDYDGTRNNKLHNTASRLCGDTLPKFEASTTCSDGWCTLLTLLAANFSIRPCLISHRVVTGKTDSLCHFLHVSWSVTHIHHQPTLSHFTAPPQNPILEPDTCISPAALPFGVTYPQSNQSAATSSNMSVAPMLNICSVDAMRHLDNPSTPDLSRTITPDIPCPPSASPFVLGAPSEGTIAQRRQLRRAIHSLAQRQLKSHTSGILRFERERSVSVDRSMAEGSSAINTRRNQHRVTLTKRRAIRRVRSRAGLTTGQRLLTKKESMVFFGEYKANPRSGNFMGCVVS